jgi:hypothetical protein
MREMFPSGRELTSEIRNRGGGRIGTKQEETVPVVLIMKELKIFRLRSELAVAPEPLGAKESAVVGIIETFNRSITPRFSDGNENHFDA